MVIVKGKPAPQADWFSFIDIPAAPALWNAKPIPPG